jgi:DNA topoisomerase-2
MKDLTEYHHGETSSQEAIIAMAQDFCGSNNIPLLFPQGLFGSRKLGGQDHSSARYLETFPTLCFPYIFREEDHNLLKILEDRGKPIEPEFLLPIIPLHIANGSEGIGTGWSTSIPSCLPEEILRCLRKLLSGETIDAIKPGYVGFKGQIKVRDYNPRRKGSYEDQDEEDAYEKKEKEADKKKEEDKEEEKEQEDDKKEEESLDPALRKLPDTDDVLIDEKTTKVMVSRGIFESIGPGKILITELPVGRWSKTYELVLEKMLKNKKIKDFECHAIDNIVKFIVKGLSDEPSYKTLHLEKNFSLNNMILLGEGYKPKKYESLDEILQEFYKFRLPWYQKRKDLLLEEMRKKIEFCRQRVKLLQLIEEKQIKIRSRSKKEITEKIKEYELDPKIMDGLKLWDISKDDIEKYKNEKKQLEDDYEVLEKKTPQILWLSDLIDLEKALIKMKLVPKLKTLSNVEEIDETEEVEEKSEDEESPHVAEIKNDEYEEVTENNGKRKSKPKKR